MVVIAVFSDVHGNTPALRAVLDSISQSNADIVVNLGDIASGGVDPRGTLDLLCSLSHIHTIRGNHERQLVHFTVEAMSRSDQHAHAVLTPHHRSWLTSLPSQSEPWPGVFAFHGTPDSDLTYLLQTVEPAGLREATDNEIAQRLGVSLGRYSVYLCGHTHLQRSRRLPSGELIVNPGSVGWPAYRDDQPYPHAIESGTPHARYSTIKDSPHGWEVIEHAIHYDVEEAVFLAEHYQRPDIAHALRTGRT